MPAPAPVEDVLALAIRHVNAGQIDRAKLLCEHALRAHPPHAAVRQLLAVIALQLGDAVAATDHADASLALRPGHAPTQCVAADAWFRRSLDCQAQSDASGEERALREVVRLAPDRAEAFVNLGIALQERGALDEAMRAYGRACALREACFGRVAHALATASAGRLWLDLDALRAALRAAAA